MAVPSSPTRRQTGFQLPDSSQNQFNATNDSEFSTRSRNDTQDTITQSHLDHIHDQTGIISQLQPLPIPGTISATQQHQHQPSQSPSDLPTPPDAESNLNLSIQPSSTSSQPTLVTRPDEILKPNQNQILSTVLPTNNVRQVLPIQQQPPQRYPSSTASSNPGSLSSSAGGTSALTTASNKNVSSLNHNYSTSNHSNPHSQPRNSFGFGYSPYSTKSSGFKTSAERGLPRDRDREIEGTPERDPNAAASSSSRIVEGEGTGDSAGVFSFSSPYFGPQSFADEDIDLDQDGSCRNQAGEEMKSPGWAAITLGQLSLGSPDVSSLSTTPYSTSISNQNSGSIPKSSTMMSLSSSQGGGASSSSSSRRYPPNSSSANNSSRPNSSRVHGPSSFNSGSPASRSLPSADAAIHAAAMHRRASYNRTASGAQRPSLIQSSSQQHHSSLGLSPASPSPIGMATHAGRPRQSGGVSSRRKNERSRSRNRYTSKGRNPTTSNRDVEFDEDATDDDEMVLDINDKDHNHLVDDDDDTEDELDHSGSVAGSNIESSVIGEMDTDLEMDESEMGSNYDGGENKRMKDSNVNGWDIYSRDNDSNASRSLSGYYTSTRGEYVSSSNGNNGISIGNNNKNANDQSGISRPYLLDRVNKSSSSGTSPSLGLSLGHGLDSHSPRNNAGGSSSFGTSPSSFGRHHPYASTSRSNSNFGSSHQSASPSRSIGNQSGMSNHHHHSSRSTGSINNDLDVGSNSLPTRMGIGVSPLGKTSVSKKNKNEDSMAIEDDDDTDDEIFDDDEMEEDLRNKVKGLTVGSQNNTKSTLSSSSNARPIRKSNTIRRTSFQSDYDYGTGLSSSLTNKSTATLKDLESIISSSPKKTSTKNGNSNGNGNGNGEKSTASISAAGIREKLGGSSNCSAFISKLWHLMSNPDKYQDYITWSTSGDSIILYNDQDRQDVFAKEILPKLFKHGNVASFVRQLNLYGFQRVPTSRSLDSAEQEVAISQASNSSSSNPTSRGGRPKLSSIATSAGAFYGSHSAFVHPNFMRGGEDRLPSMKPRSSKGKKVKDDVGDISTSPSNVSLINNGEKKSKTNGRKVDNSKVIVNDQDEETDDEDDLAFD